MGTFWPSLARGQPAGRARRVAAAGAIGGGAHVNAQRSAKHAPQSRGAGRGMTRTDRSRALRNARQQRWRARQHPHRRELVASVPVSPPVLALLVETGWLQPCEASNREQIGSAVAALLKDAAKVQRNP